VTTPISARRDAIQRRVEGIVGIPATDGNRIAPLRNGVEIFPAMLAAIEAAEHTIEFLTFVYWEGEIAERMAEALAERARAGVRVRVLLDGFGARPIRRVLVRTMQGAGCDVRWFRPIQTWKLWQITHRTHRKILVVDRRLGFTGGVGIAEEWTGDARNPSEWRDTHFRIEGPAVDGLRAAFYDNWMENQREGLQRELEVWPHDTTGPSRLIVVRSSAGIGWTQMAMLLDVLIASATERIRIATAYFAPDDGWLAAFGRAIERGAQVQVMIPGPYNDKRVSEIAGGPEIETLLRLGVEIHRFQPTMLHAKVILIDGVAACIGSPNFNQRSIAKDDELAVVAFDPDLVEVLDRHYQEDLERSIGMELGSYAKRGLLRRCLEAVVRPVRDHV
jgi:cardiolipin synthase